ncbi:hypothetical protein OAT06_01265 [Nitrospinaceae bacterium]|nr:hypothetical protein [Nitrospinaceae bacterium]
MKEEPFTESPIVFLLMGASNLARGYSMLTHHLSECLEKNKTEFLNALGPGRGFCARGGIFNITYSPIQDCRIIESAEKKSKKALHTVVLITDIGNDLMYGVSADTLIASLDIMIDEILKWDADIFLTSIHVNLKKDISPTIFLVLRILLYRSSKVNYEEMGLSILQINDYLADKVSKNERMHLITGLEAFAGLDKIHYSLLKTHAAWSAVAEKIFRVINVPVQKKLRLMDGIRSIFSNLKRLIFCDMFFLKKKGREFF